MTIRQPLISSSDNHLDQLINVATFLLILASIFIFFVNQPSLVTKYSVLFFMVFAVIQNRKDQNGFLIVLPSLFLIVHTIFFLYLSTPMALIVVLFILLGTVNMVLYTFLKNILIKDDVIVINFLIISSFTIALIMPTNLFNLATITSLPYLISIPAIIKKTTPIKPYLLHALVTGLVGAGLITSSAVMFG